LIISSREQSKAKYDNGLSFINTTSQPSVIYLCIHTLGERAANPHREGNGESEDGQDNAVYWMLLLKSQQRPQH